MKPVQSLQQLYTILKNEENLDTFQNIIEKWEYDFELVKEDINGEEEEQELIEKIPINLYLKIKQLINFGFNNNEQTFTNTNDDVKSSNHNKHLTRKATKQCLGTNSVNLNCIHVQRFVKIMNQYTQNNQNNMHFENIDIMSIFNDYMHLLHNHNKDEYFEYIVNTLMHCDILKCESFKRNNRERDSDHDWTQGLKIEMNELVNMQIMDKMHCCFQHCYDIGNKITMKERTLLDNVTKTVPETSLDDSLSVTNIRKLNELFQSKRELHGKAFIGLNKNRNTKYSQLFMREEKSENTHDDRYNFGYKFTYGYDYEEDEIYTDEDSMSSVTISPKYGSFKEELTSNQIATITMRQFDVELKKAQIHFDSEYCKNTFRPFNKYNCYEMIHIEHLLSLIIYCNYTNLQDQFSKTYRMDNGSKHNQFYFLGKCLKISIHTFGTSLRDMHSEVRKFYHGIGEQLLLPEYVTVKINTPLSTSSSFEVAANFTNLNEGLIIEFGGYMQYRTKYFSVSWLSD
eukprot:524725_1